MRSSQVVWPPSMMKYTGSWMKPRSYHSMMVVMPMFWVSAIPSWFVQMVVSITMCCISICINLSVSKIYIADKKLLLLLCLESIILYFLIKYLFKIRNNIVLNQLLTHNPNTDSSNRCIFRGDDICHSSQLCMENTLADEVQCNLGVAVVVEVEDSEEGQSRAVKSWAKLFNLYYVKECVVMTFFLNCLQPMHEMFNLHFCLGYATFLDFLFSVSFNVVASSQFLTNVQAQA